VWLRRAELNSSWFYGCGKLLILPLKQGIKQEFDDFQRLHFVLSGFTLHLASHFGKSFSSHG
jgi:hypothetical protein